MRRRARAEAIASRNVSSRLKCGRERLAPLHFDIMHATRGESLQRKSYGSIIASRENVMIRRGRACGYRGIDIFLLLQYRYLALARGYDLFAVFILYDFHDRLAVLLSRQRARVLSLNNSK